jgi:hypothetical protein
MRASRRITQAARSEILWRTNWKDVIGDFQKLTQKELQVSTRG